MTQPCNAFPRVIVGGGLRACLRALSRARWITVVDRRTIMCFSRSCIRWPRRRCLRSDQRTDPNGARHQQNCEVVLAEVTGVEVAARRLLLAGGSISYDY